MVQELGTNSGCNFEIRPKRGRFNVHCSSHIVNRFSLRASFAREHFRHCGPGAGNSLRKLLLGNVLLLEDRFNGIRESFFLGFHLQNSLGNEGTPRCDGMVRRKFANRCDVVKRALSYWLARSASS